jgi:hypothetical protein
VFPEPVALVAVRVIV